VADDGNRQRKPDFRTAVEDLKTLVTVFIERLSKLSPGAWFAIGVVGTLVLARAFLGHLRHLLGVTHALEAPHCNVHRFSLPPLKRGRDPSAPPQVDQHGKCER
jgi:hypothetical protein